MGLITYLKKPVSQYKTDFTMRKKDIEARKAWKQSKKMPKKNEYFHQLWKMKEEGKPIERKLEELYNKRYISRKDYDEWIGMDAEAGRK